MNITLSMTDPADYARFLRIKSLPAYRFTGRTAWFPDEYAERVGVKPRARKPAAYEPWPGLFDYQVGCSRLACRKERFAVFAECGLGKTLIGAEFARYVLDNLPKRKAVLWVSPPMVVRQTCQEIERFYGNALRPEIVKAADLPGWLESGGRFGITNYEALKPDLPAHRLGCIIPDESSVMKSHYGAYGTRLIEMGKGVRFKLCLTGTPAPNDRIEYANHAVFLDRFPTVNAFLARFFVNRGETGERWELKPHALRPFYRALSDWCIFLSDPSVYGWKDNTDNIPPMSVEVLDVDMTVAQRAAVQAETGDLFGHPGGITSRSKLARIAKGIGDGEATGTHKPEFIRRLVGSWPDESTILWCKFNREQEEIAALFPGCANISGDTPMEERDILIEWFKGEICTCERQRRIASICANTTRRTSIDGRNGQGPSVTGTTRSAGPNIRRARSCNGKHANTSASGKRRTPTSDSPKDSGHTGSPSNNIDPYSPNKTANAPFADRHVRRDQQDVFTSITVIPADGSGGFSAGNAISESESSRTIHPDSKRPLCTCELGEPRGRILLSKPRVMGFGLNLQICTRMVFSTCQDSYEEFWQAVKRANRVGSTRPLKVYIPVTDVERPMAENVLRKARQIESDTREQERLFHEQGYDFGQPD